MTELFGYAIIALAVALIVATARAWHQLEAQETRRRKEAEEAWQRTIGYQRPQLVPKNSAKPHGQKARPE